MFLWRGHRLLGFSIIFFRFFTLYGLGYDGLGLDIMTYVWFGGKKGKKGGKGEEMLHDYDGNWISIERA